MSVGVALMAVQIASHAVGAIEGKAQADAEADALNEKGRQRSLQGEIDMLADLRQTRAEDGAALAASAAAGVGSGNSALSDIVRANAEARWQQAFNIRTQADAEAAASHSRAKDAKRRGRAALVSGFFRAGAAALTGLQAQGDRRRVEDAEQGERERRRRQPQPLGRIPLPTRLPGDI